MNNAALADVVAKATSVLALGIVKYGGVLLQESLEPLTDAVQFRKDLLKPRCWEPNMPGNPVTTVSQLR